MKKNMGLTDKVIRVIIAIVIAVLYFTNMITGAVAAILLILAVLFLLTSFLSLCPLYLPFGITTCKKK
ncbi:YgaP-like transmembrane domain [Niabella aquatica]